MAARLEHHKSGGPIGVAIHCLVSGKRVRNTLVTCAGSGITSQSEANSRWSPGSNPVKACKR